MTQPASCTRTYLSHVKSQILRRIREKKLFFVVRPSIGHFSAILGRKFGFSKTKPTFGKLAVRTRNNHPSNFLSEKSDRTYRVDLGKKLLGSELI